MNRIAAVSSLLLLTCGLALGQAAKPPTKPAPSQGLEQQLIAREKALIAAEARHDWNTVSQALTDDFFEASTDGQIYTKQQIAKMFADAKIESASAEGFQFYQLAPTVALTVYEGRATASYKGQSMPSHVRVSSVWVKRGGEWKIRFHQATPIADKALE